MEGRRTEEGGRGTVDGVGAVDCHRGHDGEVVMDHDGDGEVEVWVLFIARYNN